MITFMSDGTPRRATPMPVPKHVNQTAQDRSHQAQVAAVETRPAIERGDYASVIKGIQARFPKIRARLAE